MTNQITKHKRMTGAWGALILSALYAVLPLDIIPDTFPFAGWIDDIIVLAMGVLHFFQRSSEHNNSNLAAILKMLKWILIALVSIAVLLMLLFGSFVVSLLSK